eukprot:4292796-Ditylum_brightwellii.AAC.1
MIQDPNNSDAKTNNNKIPTNAKKRRTVALSMEDFPALRTSKKPNKMSTNKTITTTSTNTSIVSTVSNDHIQNIDAKISTMQNQGRALREEIESMKSTIKSQIKETLDNQIKTNIESMKNDIVNFFNNQILAMFNE